MVETCRAKVFAIKEKYRDLEHEELWAYQEQLIEKLKQYFIESECYWLEIKEGITYITYIEYDRDGRIVDGEGENLLWANYEHVAELVDYLTEQKIL